jgi:hypothetical protein
MILCYLCAGNLPGFTPGGICEPEPHCFYAGETFCGVREIIKPENLDD